MQRIIVISLAFSTVVFPVASQARPLVQAQRLALDLGRAARGTCQAGEDLVSAQLSVRNVDPQAVQRLGESGRVGPYQFRLVPGPRRTLSVVLDAQEGVVRCRIIRGRGKLQVLVGRLDRQDLLPEFRQSLLDFSWSKYVPYDLAKHTEKKLGQLVRRQAYDQAREYLEGLPKDMRLDTYRQMRMADLHVLAGRIPTAYAFYNSAAQGLARSCAKLLSHTRAAELAYVVEGALPDPHLLEQLAGAEREMGVFAQHRMSRLLLLAGRLEEGLRLTPPEEEKLARKLVNARLRRALWGGNAFAAALFYLTFHDKHPNAFAEPESRLMSAQAFLSLGLAQDAVSLLQLGLSVAESDVQKERILVALAQAYQEAGQSFRASETANYYLARYPQGTHRQAIRLQRAQLRIAEGNYLGAQEDLRQVDSAAARQYAALLQAHQGQVSEKREAELKSLAQRQQQLLQQYQEVKE